MSFFPTDYKDPFSLSNSTEFYGFSSSSSPINITGSGYLGDQDDDLSSLGSYPETASQSYSSHPSLDMSKQDDFETDVIAEFLDLEPEPEFVFDIRRPETFFLESHATNVKQKQETNTSLETCLDAFSKDVESMDPFDAAFDWQLFFEIDSIKKLWKPEPLTAFLYKYSELYQKYFNHRKDKPQIIEFRLINLFGSLELFFKQQVYLLSNQIVIQNGSAGLLLDSYKSFLRSADLYNLFPMSIFSLLSDSQIASCSQFIFIWDLFLENKDKFTESIEEIYMVSDALLSVQKIRMMNQGMLDRQNHVLAALDEIFKKIENEANK